MMFFVLCAIWQGICTMINYLRQLQYVSEILCGIMTRVNRVVCLNSCVT